MKQCFGNSKKATGSFALGSCTNYVGIELLDNLQRNLCVYKMVNDWREEHIDGTRQKIQDKECKPQIEIKNS